MADSRAMKGWLASSKWLERAHRALATARCDACQKPCEWLVCSRTGMLSARAKRKLSRSASCCYAPLRLWSSGGDKRRAAPMLCGAPSAICRHHPCTIWCPSFLAASDLAP